MCGGSCAKGGGSERFVNAAKRLVRRFRGVSLRPMNTRFGLSLFLAGVPLLFSDGPKDNILAVSPTRVSLMSKGVSPRRGLGSPKAGIAREKPKKSFPFEGVLVMLPRDPVGTQPGTFIMKTKLTLFVTVLAVALFAVGCASSSLKEGLVAYYPFNGNVLDESGKGNHGAAKATLVPATDRFGDKGKAYNFDAGHVHVENHPSLQMSDQLTISAWVKNPEESKPTVLGKWYQDRKNYSYVLYANTPAGFRLHDGKGNFVELIGWSFKNKDQWNHFVATYNGQHAKVYINGKMEAQVSANEKIHVNDNPVTIGADGYGAETHFKGEMDDVRIYNRALSAEEVKALYDLEKPKGK
jgi:hypothetical protein